MASSLGLLMLACVLGVTALAGYACDIAPGGAGGAAPSPADTPAAALVEATLVRVIDGDTIWVRLPDGSEEKARYIGIDAPETAHPDGPGEYLGDEASAYNARLLGSGPLRLQTDIEERDPFGRLLAYLWAGDVFINERLVLDGYARAHSYPPNLTRQSQLQEAQREAQAARAGIWASSTTT